MEFLRTAMYVIWTLVGAGSLVMGVISVFWYRKYFKWAGKMFDEDTRE